MPETGGTDLIESLSDMSFSRDPLAQLYVAPADALPIPDNSVDLIVTSPPYWNKRDYGVAGQIGNESTPDAFVESLLRCMKEWKRVLRPTGSLFLNIGDSYYKKTLLNIPGMVEQAAVANGWLCRNRIIWSKPTGMPEPAKDRLANRYEYIIHLTMNHSYYYDTRGYCEHLGVKATPGDVWEFPPDRSLSPHLAPYPKELVRRVITLACPPAVCAKCGKPVSRIEKRTAELDMSRPQARRAMQIAREKGLTEAHIDAIQSFGISDVGKATKFQNGTGRSSEKVVKLAMEAKEALGGYFREFTFAKRRTVGWDCCDHDCLSRGVVFDPFVGTGTTLRVALEMNRDSIGSDLKPVIDSDLLPLLTVEAGS